MAQIQAWINAEEATPAPKFLTLVDILGAIDETLPYGEKMRRQAVVLVRLPRGELCERNGGEGRLSLTLGTVPSPRIQASSTWRSMHQTKRGPRPTKQPPRANNHRGLGSRRPTYEKTRKQSGPKSQHLLRSLY